MLTVRQYKVLKHINAIINSKQYKSNTNSPQIIGDRIYENIKYPQYSVDVIIKELHENNYIYDLFCEGSSVHTITIENKGKDAIANFYKEHFKLIFSKIFWMLLGSLITLICQIILKII